MAFTFLLQTSQLCDCKRFLAKFLAKRNKKNKSGTQNYSEEEQIHKGLMEKEQKKKNRAQCTLLEFI